MAADQITERVPNDPVYQQLSEAKIYGQSLRDQGVFLLTSRMNAWNPVCKLTLSVYGHSIRDQAVFVFTP